MLGFNRVDLPTMPWRRKRNEMRNCVDPQTGQRRKEGLFSGLPAKQSPEPQERSFSQQVSNRLHEWALWAPALLQGENDILLTESRPNL